MTYTKITFGPIRTMKNHLLYHRYHIKSMVIAITSEPVSIIVPILTIKPTAFTVYVCSIGIACESHTLTVILYISSNWLFSMIYLSFAFIASVSGFSPAVFASKITRFLGSFFLIALGFVASVWDDLLLEAHRLSSSFNMILFPVFTATCKAVSCKNVPMSCNFDWNSIDICF